MSELRKAAEKVLRENKPHGEFLEALDELRKALAQQEQEPFGYFRYDLEWDGWVETESDDGKPLYTSPPKREWVGLTDDDFPDNAPYEFTAVVRWTEAKLKEKNT